MATMEDKRKKLTPVQKRFVEEYLKDPSDGAAAYMQASGSTNKKSCSVQASKLLKMPKVEAALEDMANDLIGPLKARILKNVEFWLEIRDGNVQGAGQGPLVSKNKLIAILEEFGLSEESEMYAEINELQSFNVNHVKVADRMKASDSLAKWMQMFVEKKEITGNVAVQIVDDI